MDKVIIKDTRIEKGTMKLMVAKLSRGLMLPIALLPIAGLFLGVGAGFENIISQIMGDADPIAIAQASFIFTIMKNIGDVIFANLATLFCLGVAVAFAEDAGVAVFSALVGWIVFNATQSTMIWAQPAIDGVVTYNILWWVGVPSSVITQNVGITSLQTSVFGGIIIGLFVAFLYNKFHKFEMPKLLGFFSGTKFVPIITFLTVPLWGFFFLMIWPLLGIWLEEFGTLLGTAPSGLDSFIFGVFERALVPFGLHHAFYAPLWYTTAGGSLNYYNAGAIGDMIGEGNQGIWFAMQSEGIPFNILPGVMGGLGTTIDGWAILPELQTIDGVWVISHNGEAMYTLTEGVNPGNYQQGKYPFMLFGLPAAGIAMIMAAKKENREVAFSVIGAAALTSFLTGITEPLEFTFLFLAPALFYGFHVWMCGLSFMILDLLGTHMGMTFSGGIIDFSLYGILPDATGMGANCFWVIPVGLLFAPIYYLVFYYSIIKFNLKTPGRDGEEVSLVSKADFQKNKEEKKSAKGNDRTERVSELEKNLGGVDNLISIDACITRLRLTVKDRSVINDDGLKKMGAAGIVGKEKNLQIIFGWEADIFKSELKKIKSEK